MWQRLSILAVLAVIACTDDTTAELAPLADDLKGDRGGRPAFVAIDPSHPLEGTPRATIMAALNELNRVAHNGTSGRQRMLATETLARIQAGDVLIGAISDARGGDLWHMCRDLESLPCDIAFPTEPNWTDRAVVAALNDEIAGYTWGNRLYFNLDGAIDAAFLAATLVHEVNHALNRSECSYYRDYFAHEVDPTLAFVEEYRAFVSECVFKRGKNATAARCDAAAHAELVERDYGLSPDLSIVLDDPSAGTRVIAESLFADDGTFGRFNPTTAAWPYDFSECEIAAP